MKKITLLYLALLLSFTGFAQFTEGFESTAGPDALPSTNWTLGSGNWVVFDNGVGLAQRWKINTTVANVHGGAIAAYAQNENVGINNTSEDYLATPLVTIPANGQLHFWSRTVQSGDQGTRYNLMINTVNGTQTTIANYTTVQQWTETSLSTTYNVYEEKIVDLSAYAGQQVYLAFMMTFTQPGTGLGGDRWLLDDVNLVQQCLVPTNIVITPSSTTALITWNDPNGATSWEIEVVPATSALTGIGTVITTNPFTISGLTPNTPYICSIRALCSTTNVSTWTPTSNFTTTPAPVGCGGNFLDSGGATGSYQNGENITTLICPSNPTDLVTITFTSFSTENCCDHLAVYSGTSVATGTLLGTYQGTTLPPSFTSAVPGGCFTFVFTSDSSVTSTGWATNITCAPAPSCTKPSGLAVSQILSTSVSLSWTQSQNPNNTTASAWQVLALPCGSAAPTASSTGWVDAPSNPFVYTGLSPYTCYDFYVRAACSASDLSAWSVKATATTQTLAPLCGQTFYDTGGASGNYSNSETSITTICAANPTDLVTVTFTSFNTQATNDVLTAYDGSNSSAALLGAFSGTTLPPVLTSTVPGGCLYFVFTSNATTNRAGWVANVTCAPAPTCTRTKNLIANPILSTSATLSWTQPQNPDTTVATSWQVIALPCGSTAPTASTVGWTVAPTNPFVLTGLSPVTCYDFYVRATCSASDSSAWSIKASGTTQILPPACGGVFLDSGGSTGSYQNGENITTTICPTNTTDLVTVSFTAFATENCCDHLAVYAGNSTSGTLLGTYQGTTLPPDIVSTVPGGCLTFVFTSDTSVTSTGWSANVTCAPAPTCTKPTNLAVSTLLSTSATLAWTQPQNPDTSTASAWQVIALPCGSAAPTASTTGWTAAPTNPFILTGLTPSTCYDYYVRAVCSASDSSVWSVKATGTTQALPPVCGGNYVDTGGTAGSYGNSENNTTTICPTNSSDLVTVTFTSFATENCCDHLSIYDGNSATGTLLGTFQGTTLPPEFTSSVPGGCLTFVFTSDSSVTAAGWVANIACAPAPTCSKPVSLTVVPSATTATLNWTQPQNPGGGTATAWNVIVQPAGAGTPAPGAVGITVTSLPYVVTGLTVGTNYEYWVSAVCSSTDSSPWAGPKPFFTSVSCGDSQPFCGDTGLSYQNTTGAPSYGTIGCLFTTPNPAWYFMQVQQTGTLSFQIGQTSTGGTGLDVDYICWGPFTAAQYAAMCSNLYNFPSGNTTVPNNVVSCSYSAAAIENFTITNAVSGNYYLVLITNYSNQVGSVTFTQTNNGSTGAGTTNCNIVCSVDLGPSQVTLCNQASYTITSTNENADSYAWYNGTTLIPGATGSTLTVTQSGTYQCVITCGLNTANDTITVTFNTLQTPTFNPIANICQNASAPSLPATSTNGITGTWTPATIDTSVAGTVTHTFTPTTGLCAATVTLDVTVDPKTVTTFSSIPDLCQNAAAPSLPTTSNEGITGTWNPTTISTTTAGTTIYTFTPTTGLCATTATLSVTVSGTITPTFNAIPNICLNGTAPALPTTSNEGVTGTWLPTTIDTSVAGTFIYNFTPDATPSQSCAVSSSISVTITGQIVPTFAAIPNICQFGTAPALPTTSNEGITGTWVPNAIDTSIAGTVTYNFTPDATPAQACAIASSITVTIDPQTTPLFTAVPDVCAGSTMTALPTTSNNNISGTWFPPLNNTATTLYTFTPTAGQCATTATMTINVSSQITPLFNAIPTVCGGTTAPALPSTSTNGVSGTWSPLTINTTTAGTFPYLFTPTGSTCAIQTTIYVTVSTVPTPVVSVVTQPTCTLPTGTINVDSPSTVTGNLPTNLFISEVTDATSGSLTYVELFNGTGAPIDLSNYKLKFYNNGNSTTSCDLVLTGIIANNTTNVIKVSAAPNQSGISPDQTFTTCGGVNTNDNIRLTTSSDVEIDNWGRTDGVDYTPNNAPGYVYRRVPTATIPSVTWNAADWTSIAPEDYSDIGLYPPFLAPVQYVYNVDGGTYQSSPVFSGLTPGTHTVTVQDVATGCISAITTITINAVPATITSTFNPIAPICNGDALTLPATSTEGYTGTWAPAVDNTVTTTYTFTPTAGQCALPNTLTVVVNQPVQATFNAIAPICNGDALTLPATSTEGYTGTWAPAVD
ncbi:fibronectin type III domain-containing protein, partial [Flavobacterium sp. SUN046]|uniref:fibronectin type III domain-containing protein n=1 Tax=Flavobacterium sp. SUN046 TaxID=3002440 RepID=UPI002DBB5FF4